MPGHSGNQTYTSELIDALNNITKDHTFFFATYWKKKKVLNHVFKNQGTYKILNYYLNPKLLVMRSVTRVTSCLASLYMK